MSDTPSIPPPGPDEELAIDVTAFLPDGTEVGADDGWGDDAPEPAVPAWALDDEDAPTTAPAPVTADEPAADEPTAEEPAPEEPAPDEPEPVDQAAEAGGADQADAVDRTDVPEPADEIDRADPVAPPAAAPSTVDITVLEQVEAELADVDAALAAIDAGDLARSPLLTALLAEPGPDTVG